MAEEMQSLQEAPPQSLPVPDAETPKAAGLLGALSRWPLPRKLALLTVLLVSIAVFAVIILQARHADYQTLFANMTGSDAAAVVEWLKERKISYRLEDGGRDILIPADKVYEARLALAGAGLPQGGGVGFEIFDKQSFGLTDFAQKVNYRRALQGELARTIASLAPVESARVHLALPEKRLFAEDQQSATASVIVKLSHGGLLKDRQIQGIVHLVSGSIEGLEPANVTVVDAIGRVMTEAPTEDSVNGLSPGMLKYQQAMERRLESRGQSLLDRAVGAGNAMVRVTAKVDFAQRERVEESFDPNATAIRSESAVTEKNTSESLASPPGVQGNIAPTQSASAGNASSRTEENASYEISKVVSTTVDPVGRLESLSVSVLVADRVQAGGENGAATTEPRSEQELQEIEQMIRSALGLDTKRGDQISVVSMPFETGFENVPMVQSSPVDQINRWMPMIKYALLGLGALMAYLLLVRPMMRTLQTDKVESQEVYDQFKTVEQLEQELRGGQTPLLTAPDDFVSQLRREITKTAATPTQVIKAWLNEG